MRQTLNLLPVVLAPILISLRTSSLLSRIRFSSSLVNEIASLVGSAHSGSCPFRKITKLIPCSSANFSACFCHFGLLSTYYLLRGFAFCGGFTHCFIPCSVFFRSFSAKRIDVLAERSRAFAFFSSRSRLATACRSSSRFA